MTVEGMIRERLDRVLTQYRESPNLRFLIEESLRPVAEVAEVAAPLPDAFDLDRATGEQLTFVGRRLGFGRHHEVCETQPVFGFDCGDYAGERPVAGFCQDGVTWLGCDGGGVGEISVADDDLYRRLLRARRRQFLGRFSRDDLYAALVDIFGIQRAVIEDGVEIEPERQPMIVSSGNGRVVVAPNRELTAPEIAILQLIPRILPVALGVRVLFHFGEVRNPFGFGPGWSGFCVPLLSGDEPILTEAGAELLTEDGEPIESIVSRGADWICPVDVKPYNC